MQIFWKVFSQAACVLTLMSFVLKTRNSVSKTRIFALKTRNCAFKMMKFAAQQLLRQASSGHPTRPRYFPTFPAGFSMGKFDQMWDLPLISSMFLLKRQESRGNQPGFVHTSYALLLCLVVRFSTDFHFCFHWFSLFSIDFLLIFTAFLLIFDWLLLPKVYVATAGDTDGKKNCTTGQCPPLDMFKQHNEWFYPHNDPSVSKNDEFRIKNKEFCI